MSLQKDLINEDLYGRQLYPFKDINFEVYFEYTDLFKMTYILVDSKPLVKFFKGKVNDIDNVVDFEEIPQDLNLFYTIAINYSLYSLNSRDYLGIHIEDFDWLSSLTHKNDGYQTPIVITPMREDGNIDINVERQLTKQRVLINLLQLHINDSDNQSLQSFRSLDNDKTFSEVEILSETAKILRYRNNLRENEESRLESLKGYIFRYNEATQRDKERLLNNFIENLSGEQIVTIFEQVRIHYDIPLDVDLAYQMYIILKLYKISVKYRPYFKYYDVFKDLIYQKTIDLSGILFAVDRDNSHVTDKLKQVLNYIKSKSLQELYCVGNRIHLDKIDSTIEILRAQGIKSLGYPKILIDSNFKVLYQHLIIPPIFEYEYYYIQNDDTIKANNLSSGEQQQINSIGSILYHIRNLDSIGENEGIQYRSINIVLDEIELYFHPEYQRRYIYKLLSYLKGSYFELNNIWNVNLLFLTHSPFVLSDIPSQKILRMNDGSPFTDNNGLNSFGANIHDLLNDEFFMAKGSMGEFAKSYINDLIAELSDDNSSISDDKNSKELLKNKIEIIGEPLIKNSLIALWHQRFNKELSIPSYDRLVEFYKENNK